MAVPPTERRPEIVTVNKDSDEEHIKVREFFGPVAFADSIEQRVFSSLANWKKQRELENTTGSTPTDGGNSSRN